jgi:methionyl-tRNA synthetase
MTESIKHIEFEEWSKIELRVAQIINVEDIENADKLYKLTLDLGNFGKRIVCAGLKQHYKKSDLLNKKVILFVNLTPRKMKGIESQGMILAAVSEDESQVVLLTPEENIELGSKIR